MSGYSLASCSRMVKEKAFTAAFSCTSQINEKQASITSPFNSSGIETYCNNRVMFLRTALCNPGFRSSETKAGKCLVSNCGCVSAMLPIGQAARCITIGSPVKKRCASSSKRFCEWPIHCRTSATCDLECLASISSRRFNSYELGVCSCCNWWRQAITSLLSTVTEVRCSFICSFVYCIPEGIWLRADV